MNRSASTLDTIVIGAGISGLTVAHGLARRGHSLAVIECGPRAGGVIGSGQRDGFLYELGPNSTLVDALPQAEDRQSVV